MLLPKVIYIETTNLCNANCIMCPHEKITRKLDHMTDNIFYKIVNDCKKQKIKHSQIFLHKEGEPLLDNQIYEKIKYIKNEIGVNNEIGINTNAMLLSKENSKKLLSSGLDVIYFSVDGVDKESYEKIRKNLDYNIVLKNIKDFFKLKKSLNSPIKVIMQMLITEENSINEQTFKKIWEKYPCEFYIKRMHSYLDGGHSSLTKNIEIKQKHFCKDPFEIVVIYNNGNIGLCCWDYNNEYSIGNILDHNLFDIFNNIKSKNMRDSQIKLQCKNIVPCNRCGRIFGNDEITKY